MDIYFTTKNSGPSWNRDPLFLVYVGVSLEEAQEAVGDFQRYEDDFDAHQFLFPEIYSAIPGNLKREMVNYYSADGWWYSVVKVVFPEKLNSVEELLASITPDMQESLLRDGVNYDAILWSKMNPNRENSNG